MVLRHLPQPVFHILAQTARHMARLLNPLSLPGSLLRLMLCNRFARFFPGRVHSKPLDFPHHRKRPVFRFQFARLLPNTKMINFYHPFLYKGSFLYLLFPISYIKGHFFLSFLSPIEYRICLYWKESRSFLSFLTLKPSRCTYLTSFASSTFKFSPSPQNKKYHCFSWFNPQLLRDFSRDALRPALGACGAFVAIGGF